MKPSQLLCAKSSKGVVLIEGLYSNNLRIIGSSVANFIPNNNRSNSVALSIKKGDKGFIAVVVTNPSIKHVEQFDFFLDIGWTEDSETPHIGLDSQWVPKDPERLGVIDFFGIRTNIDGVIFSSSEYDKKLGMRYVGDHNLLCKYLAGDIEADVVEKAAAEYIEEESAKSRLPELEKKIQELTALIAEKESSLCAKEKEACESHRQEMMIYERMSATSIVIRERLSAASKVIKEVEKQWFHRPSLKEELQRYKAIMTRQ